MESFDWNNYDYSKEIIISKNSPIYIQTKEDECLKCDFLAYAALLRLVRPYVIICINDTFFAVKERIIDLFDIEKFAKVVQKATLTKSTTIEHISISDYVSSWDNIGKQFQQEIISATSLALSETLNIKLDEKGIVAIIPQKIDKGVAIVQALEIANRPLSLEELVDSLTSLYPEESWKAERVTYYARKSPDIALLGKSKCYALKKWEDVYFGSIRDLLIDILGKSEEPLHIDTLADMILQQFPNTNKKSISSTMNNDQYHRFAAFENGYFGLSERKYSDLFIPAVTEQKFSFEERFQMVLDFVEKYKRFPIFNSGELEGSLSRWLYRVSHNKTAITQDQKIQLDDFLNRYSNTRIPQTGLEVSFLERCERVKEIIQKKHRLPLSKEEPDIYSWLYKNKEKYEIYDDKRKMYFQDLLQFIHSFGFAL